MSIDDQDREGTPFNILKQLHNEDPAERSPQNDTRKLRGHKEGLFSDPFSLEEKAVLVLAEVGLQDVRVDADRALG